MTHTSGLNSLIGAPQGLSKAFCRPSKSILYILAPLITQAAAATGCPEEQEANSNPSPVLLLLKS